MRYIFCLGAISNGQKLSAKREVLRVPFSPVAAEFAKPTWRATYLPLTMELENGSGLYFYIEPQYLE